MNAWGSQCQPDVRKLFHTVLPFGCILAGLFPAEERHRETRLGARGEGGEEFKLIRYPLTVVIDKGLAPGLGWRESPAADLDSPGDAAIMPTQSESPVAVSGKPSKMVALLRKRLRQLLRVVVVLAACVAIAATAFAIWWLNSLNGLPDIGDPFDVAAFRTFSIPDDQNAFAFLRRAIEKTTPIQWGEGPHPDDPKFSWSIAHPNARKWAEENREALVLFLQGADSPDA